MSCIFWCCVGEVGVLPQIWPLACVGISEEGGISRDNSHRSSADLFAKSVLNNDIDVDFEY